MAKAKKSNDKQRIAIIGGGPAGLATAFFLTEAEDWKDKLDITVYQLGWRLGGKGATGRDMQKGARIEEHGIHGFCRFYFNTWHMLRRVYEEVGGHGAQLPTKTLDEAFLPSSLTLSMQLVNNRWGEKLLYHPHSSGNPWDAAKPSTSKVRVVKGLLAELVRRGRRIPGSAAAEGFSSGALTRSEIEGPHFDAEDLIPQGASHAYQSAARIVQSSLKAAYTEFEDKIATPSSGADAPTAEEVILRDAMDAAARELQAKENQLRMILGKDAAEDDESRRMREMQRLQVIAELGLVDLYGALLTGLLKDGFWRDGFELDELDHIDFRDWLRHHGATDATLGSSAAFGIPNILFAYEGGDSTCAPKLSTSAWLNWTLRSFLGEGEYFYFMAAGTGESVILPLYRCLQQRGVRFELFHKLEQAVSKRKGDALVIDELHFERQARTKDGAPYDPLVLLGPKDGETSEPVPVWPNEPRWGQLKYGHANQARGIDFEAWGDGERPEGASSVVLKRKGKGRKGFDHVVWAIPPSMIPLVGDDLMQREWASTVEHVTTTATQAAQLWLTRDTNDLGWDRSACVPRTARYACATFGNPLNAFVAFDDLIGHERWGANGPKGLLYLCSQIQKLPGDSSAELDRTRVMQATSSALRSLGMFMRGARPPVSDQSDATSIDFGVLHDDDPSHRGEERLGFQYFRANTRPTEAYVQAPPDNRLGRRHAWSSGYANLVVAGDWMYNGFNLGSFESATTGGRLAAFALTGHGAPEDITGFGFLHAEAATAIRAAVDDGVIPILT